MLQIGTLQARTLSALWPGSKARAAAAERSDVSPEAAPHWSAVQPAATVELASTRVVTEADEAVRAALDPRAAGGTELVPNRNASGKAQTNAFSSAKLAIASLLGVVTYPPPATIKVNGRTVTVDLETDSLTSIAARVLLEARTNSQIEEEKSGESSLYRLVVDGEVTPASPADEQVAAMVGFVQPRPASVPTVAPRAEPQGEEDPFSAETAPRAGRAPGDATGVQSPPATDGRPEQVRGKLESERAMMLEQFHAIDSALTRIREQTAPLAERARALHPEPAAGAEAEVE